MKNTNKKGFTLIELLIVIGIIAILAAAVIIAINPGQQFAQARNATRWSHMNSVANAVYSYAIDNGGEFPGCVPDTTGDENAVNIDTCSDDLVEDYMAALPDDPLTDCDYYIGLETGNRVKIWSSEGGTVCTEADGVEVIQ